MGDLAGPKSNNEYYGTILEKLKAVNTTMEEGKFSMMDTDAIDNLSSLISKAQSGVYSKKIVDANLKKLGLDDETKTAKVYNVGSMYNSKLYGIKDGTYATPDILLRAKANSFNYMEHKRAYDEAKQIDEMTGHATGGFIYGAGGPTEDKIPAMLSNGEYVINADAASKIGKSKLDFLNKQGELPHFSIGGSVGSNMTSESLNNGSIKLDTSAFDSLISKLSDITLKVEDKSINVTIDSAEASSKLSTAISEAIRNTSVNVNGGSAGADRNDKFTEAINSLTSKFTSLGAIVDNQKTEILNLAETKIASSIEAAKNGIKAELCGTNNSLDTRLSSISDKIEEVRSSSDRGIVRLDNLINSFTNTLNQVRNTIYK